MKRNEVRIQGLISGTFAFLLTLLFVVLFVCIGFNFGVFNNRRIISKVNESNYYNEVFEQLNKKSEEILLQTGLPTSVLSEVITLDRVYVAGKNYIENTLVGKTAEVKTDKIRDDLTRNIDLYFDQEQILQTEELSTGVDGIIAQIELEYRQGIQFQFIDYITTYKSHYMDLMKVVIPVIIVLIAILCFFLLRMHKYIHRGIRYIAYAVIASSGIIIGTATFLLISKQYEKVNVSPEYYRSFLVNYLNWDMKIFLYLGLIGVILSILLISLVGFLKNRISNN